MAGKRMSSGYKTNLITKLEPIRKAHRVVDAIVEQVLLRVEGVPCKKGCAYCCNQYITITLSEAMFVISDLVSTYQGKVWLAKNYSKINEHIVLLKKQVLSHPVKSWRDFYENQALPWFSRGMPCIFLENSICIVYKTRPIVCRSYFVSGNPENCASQEKGTISLLCLPTISPIEFSSSEEAAKDLGIERYPRMPIPVAVDWALIGYVHGTAGIRNQMKKANITVMRLPPGS